MKDTLLKEKPLFQSTLGDLVEVLKEELGFASESGNDEKDNIFPSGGKHYVRGMKELAKGCFQWFKDTNLKANHNSAFPVKFFLSAVFNGSKIPICNIGIYTEQNLIVPYKSHNMLFYSSNYSIHTFLHYLLPIQVHLCHIVSNGPCLCPDSHHLQN